MCSEDELTVGARKNNKVKETNSFIVYNVIQIHVMIYFEERMNKEQIDIHFRKGQKCVTPCEVRQSWKRN